MSDRPLKIDSLVLRSAADYAASQRAPGGKSGFLVTTFSPVTGWSTLFTTGAISPQADAVVTPVNNRSIAPQRPRVESVTIRAHGMRKPLELAKFGDAVFWSEAAVEKFVLPYYASKGQWLAAHLLNVLSRVFYGHVPQPPLLDEDAPAAASGDVPVPFALVHLPRSDYVGLEETAPLTADLGVLCVEDGEVVMRPLASFFPEAEEQP